MGGQATMSCILQGPSMHTYMLQAHPYLTMRRLMFFLFPPSYSLMYMIFFLKKIDIIYQYAVIFEGQCGFLIVDFGWLDILLASG